MKKILKVGFAYINRIGHEVKIVNRDGDRFMDNNGIEYGLVGVALGKGTSWDLVEYADGFPRLLMSLHIPVMKINSKGSSYYDYAHEKHEVLVKFIERIPIGNSVNPKRFHYVAHYEAPKEYFFEEYYPSEIENDLKRAFIDRKSTNFDPKELHFGVKNYAEVETAESIKWSKY